MEKIDAQNIYSNTQFGLQRLYQILSTNGNVTKDSLSDTDNISFMDVPFANLLTQNFDNADLDKDGILSKEELINTIMTIQSSGLSYQELASMSLQANGSNESINQLLEKFQQIDKNNDGKVSTAEINAFNVNTELQDKIAEITDFKSSDISSFYDAESTEEES